MFLLDTNVISELLKPQPAPAVKKWATDCTVRGDVLYVSSIAKAEMEYGVNIMSEGSKKHTLKRNVHQLFIANKKLCYTFNARSAMYYAEIRSAQYKTGIDTTRGRDDRDVMIAAIALQHKLTLATRNIKDFRNIYNLKTINPWQHKKP